MDTFLTEITGKPLATAPPDLPSKLLQISSLDLLRQLVEVSSVTLNRKGVMDVQKTVADFLHALGFRIHWQPCPDTRFADLLIATYVASPASTSFVSFVTHADTVLEQEAWGTMHICPNTQRAFGSGVIDNKGGLVVLLKGLQKYLSLYPAPPINLRVICSPNEEMGSIGFTDIFRSFAEDSVMALGFEPALDNGDIISSRRGNRWYRVQVAGREGHAGRSQGEHLNAAHELAEKIVRLHRLTNHKKGLAVNVGHVAAGRDRYNIICGTAEMKVDVRFCDFKTRDRLHTKIVDILGRRFIRSHGEMTSADVHYTIEDDCPPFSNSRAAGKAIKELQKCILDIEGHPVKARKAGGAGDVNYLSHVGGITIDGLGPVGGNMHTEDEFLNISTLESRSQALHHFLRTMAPRL